MKKYCNCEDSSHRVPGDIKSMRCDYCGKPPKSLALCFDNKDWIDNFNNLKI